MAIKKTAGVKVSSGPRKSGRTSLNAGHTHSYKVDKSGNGDTSRDNGHVHQILNFSIQSAHGHTHKLQQGA